MNKIKELVKKLLSKFRKKNSCCTLPENGDGGCQG